MPTSAISRLRAVVLLLACAVAPALQAEVSELRISKQYGLPYLAAVIVEQQRLIEKHARALGLGEIKVNWLTLGTGGSSTDSLLAGNLDFVTSGVSNMMLLWSRTGGQVKSVSAVGAVPLILVTRNPNVKTIADFTERDKISVPTIKVSMQSTILGIAAAKIYGDAASNRFDAFTISMSAPDATIALLSGAGEVNSHFSVPPYQNMALKSPGIHAVLNSTDVMGGPATITVIFGMVKFHDANPKTITAIFNAFGDAQEFIKHDRRAAAEIYLRATRDKIAVEELAAMLDGPGYAHTQAPNGTLKYAEQMFRTGAIKTRPSSWKDVFFPVAHALAGN